MPEPSHCHSGSGSPTMRGTSSGFVVVVVDAASTTVVRARSMTGPR
jgi:hypothetical protein